MLGATKEKEKEEMRKNGTIPKEDLASVGAKAKKSKAAKTKRIKKQLEGLKLIHNVLQTGLGTIEGDSIKRYTDLAKQLGGYSLSGPQFYVKQLIIEMEAWKKDGEERHDQKAIDILLNLHILVKKLVSYLNHKLESEELDPIDNILFEAFDGIWELDELNKRELKKERVTLVQLAFEMGLDEARREYVDTGWWADVESGEVFFTCNRRPIKALKYVKQEDTVFDTVYVPVLTYYPGEWNRRIRWEEALLREQKGKELVMLQEHAEKSLPDTVEKVKNLLKDRLSNLYIVLLFAYETIGKVEEIPVMTDAFGNRIMLADMELEAHEGSVERLFVLLEEELFRNQVLLGAFFYEEEKRRICVQPYSIVTNDRVIRLLY